MLRRLVFEKKLTGMGLRFAIVLGLLVSFSGLATAGPKYVLSVRGNTLQQVLNANRLNLERTIYSNGQKTVAIVSVPDSASPSLASQVVTNPNVTSFDPDRQLSSKPPVTASLSSFLTNFQTYAFSLQSDQQKKRSFASQSPLWVIGAPAGNQGNGKTVAVIDTGVDPDHPLLAGHLTAGADCVGANGAAGNCASGIPSIWNDAKLDQSTVVILDQSTVVILDQSTVVILDQSTVVILDAKSAQSLQGKTLPSDTGHGTIVASLIAAAAPGAKIMPIRAFQADGSSNLSDVVAAIYYAINNNADVINMSFDINSDIQSVKDAIAAADAAGIVLVASADNQNSNTPVYPAAYSPVIGVGSTDSIFGIYKSSFSQYGKPTVDLYAPGENLIAAYPGGHYAIVSGTSFSTAFVSAAAATLASTTPGQSTNAYYNALTKSGPFVYAPHDGNRRLSLGAALDRID